MILKLLLADDDIEMLQAMDSMLRGHADRYEVVGLAEDGAQAMELLRATRPDILITDITMPQMDGLELISEAKKLLPDLRTVLITCHEEFRYAKDAIRLMVDDYLVKYAMTEKDLLRCLEQLGQRWEQQHTHKESFNQISSEIYRSREQFKEHYIRAVAAQQSRQAAELRSKASIYGVALPEGQVTLTGFFIDDFERALRGSILDDERLLLFSLMNIISDIFYNWNPFLFLWERFIFLMLPAGRSEDGFALMREPLSQALQYAEQVLAVRPNAVFLPKAFPAENVGDAMQAVCSARLVCFYQPGGCVMEAGRGKIPFASPARHDDWLELFHRHIFQPDKLTETFLHIQDELLTLQYAPEYARDLLEQLNIVMDTAMRFHGSKLPKTAVDGETFAGCAAQVRENIGIWAEYTSLNGQVTFSEDIRRVVQYVADHLDSDISLEKVASVIYKNSSYLSRLFKRETGLTFSEYLTRKRIEKAVWLLSETSMSVEDIAQSIGIPNTPYFYKFFKRETGKKPGDLRKNRV